jgi:hypothetical protein
MEIDKDEVLRLLGKGWSATEAGDGKPAFKREIGDTKVLIAFDERHVFAGIRKDLGDVDMGGRKAKIGEHYLSVLVKTDHPHPKDALVALYELDGRCKSAALVMSIVTSNYPTASFAGSLV